MEGFYTTVVGAIGGVPSPIPRSPLLDAVNIIIACLTVFGNGMVITVMLLRRRVFSSFTNRLILHQSIIDCISGLVFFLYKVVRGPSIVVSADGSPYDQFFCRLIATDLLLWCMNLTSTYNLVVISLERFVATCHPVRHRNTLSGAKLKYALIAPWLIGFAVGLHLVFMYESHHGRCRMLYSQLTTGFKVVYTVIMAAAMYFIPMAILVYTHASILLTLAKKASKPVTGQQNASMSKAKKNVITTTMLIGAMFVVCWTPVEVLFIYSKSLNVSGMFFNCYIPLSALLACNMLVNPVIYCFMYRRFRSQLKDIVFKACCRNRVHAASNLSISIGSTLNTNSVV